MDAYESSSAVKKLLEAKQQKGPLRLAFIDIDNTWSGNPKDQQTVRDLLENNNYVVVQITNRGSDICLSSEIDPAQKTALQGLLDPDILAASLGTELLIKQVTGAYQADAEYLSKLPPAIQDWQGNIRQLVQHYTPAPYSFRTHYLDIPVFRVELECDSPQVAEKLMAELTRDPASASLHVAHDNSTLIITPRGFSKEDAVERILNALSRTLHASAGNFHLLFAGDSDADVAMGLSSGRDSEATFVIPGGASINEIVKLTKLGKIDMVSQGVYWFPNATRHVVVGDEAFPGTLGPQTLIAWLRQHP